MDFQYSPLDPTKREIRLLEILPLPLNDRQRRLDSHSRSSSHPSLLKVKSFLFSTGRRLGVSPSRPPPLECQLSTVSLDDGFAYETVSYCWGDPTPSAILNIDGCELKVPMNTERALRRLALGDRSRRVWIDAVCINQEDVEERGRQVGIMKEIYEGGRQNVVFLGDADGDRGKRGLVMIERAFENVRELMGEIERDAEGYGGSFERLLVPGAGQWRRATGPPRTKVDEEALFRLWGMPWFSRVWVFQEQALSKSNLCIFGPLQIDLDSILKVSIWLMHYHFTHIPAAFVEVPGFRAAADMWLTRSDYREYGKTDIHNAIGLSQGLGATDKRDKVFGLLGLLDVNGRKGNELLTPDYNKKYEEVLRDAMRFALVHSQSPHSILSAVVHRDETQLFAAGFPSWVFSGGWDGDTMAISLPRPGGGGGIQSDGSCNDLSGPGELNLDPSRQILLSAPNPNILTLRGCIIDTIRQTTPPFPTMQDFTKNPLVLPEWFDACELLMPPIGVDGIVGDREDRLIRTLIADVSAIGLKSTWRDRRGFNTFVEHVVTRSPIQDIRSLPATAGGDGGGAAEAAHFWRALSKCQHRRFAVMESGFVGLVPKITRVGDVVVKFFMSGMDSPVVLRKRGRDAEANTWWFVGEAYVDGIMEWQEGWEGLRSWMERGPGKGMRRMFNIW